MKWYHVIDCANAVVNPYVADTGDLMGVEEEDLWGGTPVTKWNDAAWIQARKPSNDGNPDDALQTYLAPPVYSSNLRQAIETAGIGGIQWLPIHVLRPDGTEIPGYAIANIVNLVKGALDLECSDYDVYPPDYFLSERVGKVRGIRIPVLRGEKLYGLDIVRLAEAKAAIYVSERFKDAFEKAGCTGHAFREVQVAPGNPCFIRTNRAASNFGALTTKMTTMDLGTILDQVSTLQDDLCIFAEKPWTPESRAIALPLGADFQTPKEISDQGMDYFLEVNVAKEVLEVFGDCGPTQEERHRLLIFYAENDAYPGWVYDWHRQQETEMNYACPCCGYLTLGEEPPGTFEICPVCGWEDDEVQFRDSAYEGGANSVSLDQAKQNFAAFGAIEKGSLGSVRKPRPEEIPDQQ